MCEDAGDLARGGSADEGGEEREGLCDAGVVFEGILSVREADEADGGEEQFSGEVVLVEGPRGECEDFWRGRRGEDGGDDGGPVGGEDRVLFGGEAAGGPGEDVGGEICGGGGVHGVEGVGEGEGGGQAVGVGWQAPWVVDDWRCDGESTHRVGMVWKWV